MEVRDVAGRGGTGQVGMGRAIHDRDVAYGGRLRGARTTTTTKTTTTKKQPKTEQALVNVNHMITNTDMAAFQINLLSLASLMMLLNTLSRGLSPTLPMGLDLTKNGILPAWRTSLLM